MAADIQVHCQDIRSDRLGQHCPRNSDPMNDVLPFVSESSHLMSSRLYFDTQTKTTVPTLCADDGVAISALFPESENILIARDTDVIG